MNVSKPNCATSLLIALSAALLPQHWGYSQELLDRDLQPRGAVQRDDLNGANRFVMSKDGKFLYVAPWRSAGIVIFKRDDDGTLTHVKSVENRFLKGVIKLHLSDDGGRLAAICLRSTTILLFNRDADTGLLTPEGFARTDLTWPVSVQNSPDGKFLYVGDARKSGSSSNADSQLVVYAVSETGGLKKIQTITHEKMLGMRDILISPDGKNCYASCSEGGCLIVCQRDVATGKLTIDHLVENQPNGPTLLLGVHTSVLAHSGERLYGISGRFIGDSGITVFGREKNGSLEFLREIKLEGDDFAGGNHVCLTQDERTLFASGTRSDSVAVISQDLENGRLELKRVIKDDAPPAIVTGASGLLIGPDEKHLYVASENGSAVTLFDISEK